MHPHKSNLGQVAVGGLVFSLLAVTGCQWLFSSEGAYDQRGDLALDLGNKVTMRFVWVEPMKLFVGKFEVTNKEYRRFKPEHTSGKHKDLSLDGDLQPVVNVSWDDAQQFCSWLNEKYRIVNNQVYNYRLPTVKEWETFAACGQQKEYPWGGDWPPPGTMNYYGPENPEPGPKVDKGDGFKVSCPVVRSGHNAWRLFGVGGNVWEWCQDAADEGKTRVRKGGSWIDSAPLFLTVERCSYYAPDYKYINTGFRVVAEPGKTPLP